MPLAASSAPAFAAGTGGVWWFNRWAAPGMLAGTTPRENAASTILEGLPSGVTLVEAEQVHGAGLAVVERPTDPARPLRGCDGLLTQRPGLALCVRTADCLPIFFADPLRRAVGIAHAGWRGLAAELPVRMIAAFRHAYHSRPEDLVVAMGPAIRACCYAVGPEFADRFGPFVRVREGRRTCDLVGVALEQLRRGGVPTARITDSEQCTACEAVRWFSLRREGPSTGRLRSFILVRP